MLDELYADWLAAKREEAEAVAKRRETEDKLVELLGINASAEGTTRLESGQYKVKVEGRVSRTVDAEKLQDLAAEAGLTDHLSSLFRWKPEISMTAWRKADPAITHALSGAITTKAGRPSFSVEIKE